jgi:hypothetical protein
VLPQAGLVRVDVVGCTRLDDACLATTGAGLVNEGRSVVGSVAMFSGRAVTLPRAALTARGDVAAANLSVANVRVADGGLTVHASGTVDPGLSLTTVSGNALAGSTIFGDSDIDLPALAPLNATQRFFSSIFLLTPERWVQQPAVVTLNCGISGCSAAELRDAIRAIVLQGGSLASDHPIAINTRHKSCFERVETHLIAAQTALQANADPEFIALDLREALQALGDVVGHTDIEQILDVIFSSFCIGK